MNNKIFIWIIVLILLMTPFVSAVAIVRQEFEAGNNDCSEFVEQDASNIINCDGSGIYLKGGASTANIIYKHSFFNKTAPIDYNFSIVIWVNYTNIDTNFAVIYFATDNLTDTLLPYAPRYRALKTAASFDLAVASTNTKICNFNNITDNSGEKNKLNISFFTNNSLICAINGTQISYLADLKSDETDPIRNRNNTFIFFGDQDGAGITNVDFGIHNLTWYNLSAPSPPTNDITPPIISIGINNTAPRQFEIINISANITDETSLNNSNITINFTTGKIYMNYSISGTSVTIYNITNITDAVNNVLNITVYAMDGGNNTQQNSTIINVIRFFGITSKNIYDNTSIKSFSATIFNETYQENKSTINGTITFSGMNNSLAYLINISSNENGGYFNETYNQSINTDLLASLHQTIVYIFGKQRGSPRNVTSFNASTLFAVNQSNSSGSLQLMLNASITYQISGISSGYFDILQNFTAKNQSINNLNMLFPNTNLSIIVYSVPTNTFLKNFTIYLTANATDFSENLTDNNNGNVTFSLTNNTYTLRVTAPKSSNVTLIYLLLDNSTFQNITINVGELNSINFTIYDEFNYQLIIQNVTVDIISMTKAFSINKSTQNGSLYFNELNADEYRIRYSTSNYRNRDYYFTLINGTNNTIRLFLLSIGNGTLTTFTINDQNANPAINYTLQAQRYYTNTNVYELITMKRTDAQGQAQLDLQQNNAFYKFLILSPSGVILQDTVPSTVFATAYTLRVTTEGNSYFNIRNRNIIFNNLSFSNVTNSYSFTYNNLRGLGVSTCLIAYELSLSTGENEICQTCSDSSSATLICSINDSYMNNVTTVARAYTYGATGSGGINTTAILLDELIITPKFIAQSIKEIFGLFGVFMGFLIFLTMTLIGLWNPIVAMILGTFGFIISYLLGFITLGISSISWLVGICLLAGILAYRSRA